MVCGTVCTIVPIFMTTRMVILMSVEWIWGCSPWPCPSWHVFWFCCGRCWAVAAAVFAAAGIEGASKFVHGQPNSGIEHIWVCRDATMPSKLQPYSSWQWWCKGWPKPAYSGPSRIPMALNPCGPAPLFTASWCFFCVTSSSQPWFLWYRTMSLAVSVQLCSMQFWMSATWWPRSGYTLSLPQQRQSLWPTLFWAVS